eukprot:COSAG01_NODE_6230_length_3778_cov_28.633324_6_plen_94_part_00
MPEYWPEVSVASETYDDDDDDDEADGDVVVDDGDDGGDGGGEHELAPLVDVCPLGQLVHELELVPIVPARYLPVGQSWHPLRSSISYLPTGQT